MTGLLYPKPEPNILRKQAIQRAERNAEIAAYRHVTKRDGGRCRVCGARARGMHHHHFPFRSRGGTSDVRHIILVCATCHTLAHLHRIEIGGNADIPGALVITRT